MKEEARDYLCSRTVLSRPKGTTLRGRAGENPGRGRGEKKKEEKSGGVGEYQSWNLTKSREEKSFIVAERRGIFHSPRETKQMDRARLERGEGKKRGKKKISFLPGERRQQGVRGLRASLCGEGRERKKGSLMQNCRQKKKIASRILKEARESDIL